jgi:hypothetical protein
MPKEHISRFTEHVDTSIIAEFPPGFFQKGLKHLAEHPDEQFTMQVTEKQVFLRRMKKEVNGSRPKDPINGRIISWTSASHKSSAEKIL